jgi:hypothetical protein
MTKLEFHGPFHFNEIDPKTGKIEKEEKSWDLKTVGIYIWGFIYEYDKKNKTVGWVPQEKEIKYDEDIMQFIPYYVGKADKNDSILRRLKDHHNLKNENVRKYTRFSEKYMKLFYKDPSCPIKKKGKMNNIDALKLCTPYDSPIEYFNDKACLEKIYPKIQLEFKGGYPIDLQKNGDKSLPDTLKYLIHTMNNFWFCFAYPPIDLEVSIEKLETYTYWSLNGLTLSQTGVCPLPDSNIAIEDISNNKRIFYKDANGRIQPTVKFPGY